MHHNTLIIALGLTLAARTSAAPLSELAPDIRPLFTSVSSAPPASTATGMPNFTAGKVPDHKHTPNCEHSHNASHTTTSRDAQPMTSGTGTRCTTEASGHAAIASSGYPSPFNKSAYEHPHAVKPLNRTGDYCDHPSHYNTTTTTDATRDKVIHPRMLNGSAESLHDNHTECQCVLHPSHRDNGTHTLTHHPHEQHNGTLNNNNTDYHPCPHPSHHNGTAVAEHSSYEKPTPLTPRVDVTVCLGPECKDNQIVTADLSSAGELEGLHAKRQDTEISYQDVARQMDGAMIVGGV